MKILIVGFQRSGTTLLRRILHSHPEVRRIFHEEFLLKKCPTKDSLHRYLMNYDIFPDEDNWGEKVPFYPSARKIPILKYCETWKKYFGELGRIIHIVRHPIDIGFSVESKYRGQKFDRAVNIYNKIMPAVVPNLLKEPFVYTVKYEDMLLNPKKIIPEIFTFCGLDPKIDFEKQLLKITNPKYQRIDPSRVFPYKNKKFSLKINLQPTIHILNRIPGPKRCAYVL